PAAGVVVTHPVGWGAYKVEVVAQALAGVGLPGARLCSEPVAASVHYWAREKLSAGVVAVYDLGGASCDAAVIQKDRSGHFSVIGQPTRIGHVGGVDFDDAVFGRVVNAVPAWGGLDAEDPGVLAAGVVLRRECRGAKEVLSVDTEVTIPVVGPEVQSSVRLVRAEFEELVRAQVVETLEALRGVLGSAGVNVGDVDAVVLVGGSSRVPLVAQVVSAGLGCPVVVDGDSQVAVAMGGALYARSLDSPEPLDSLDSTDTDPASPDSAGARAMDAQLETPRRPALNAAPLDVPPAERAWRDDSVRRVRRIAVAGGLALLTAAGVGSAAFLTAHTGPLLPAAADTQPTTGVRNPAAPPAPGVPAPAIPGPGAPVIPGPAAEAESRADRSDNGGAVRTTLPGSPKPPRGAAQPGPAAPPNAPQPTWATHYTWTTRWSSPPPATTDPPTTSRPAPTTTERPTTTKKVPPPEPPRPRRRRPPIPPTIGGRIREPGNGSPPTTPRQHEDLASGVAAGPDVVRRGLCQPIGTGHGRRRGTRWLREERTPGGIGSGLPGCGGTRRRGERSAGSNY
ncbi:MAG: Hsp70 family protein, partial [Pseudonocardiaceae bacterium]